jgi:formylglycine-generating enzyme required for sulfatase activity
MLKSSWGGWVIALSTMTAGCGEVVEACEGEDPTEVVEGACEVPSSCAGLPATCGPEGDESCCALTTVPDGTFNRNNDAKLPATVSDFQLDRFEITVGRFRTFVEAYPGSKPKAGAGAQPGIAGSGWSAAWDGRLPADLKAAVKCRSDYQTWTDTPGANENLPMNCITWYEAFAFCVWEGGRLPTATEWDYAAVGGSEQREDPWGSAAPVAEHAVYDCTGDGTGGCAQTDILKVGVKKAGDGKWGQADLFGSVWEWNLDRYKSGYDAECNNCTNIEYTSFRVFRGGGWVDADWVLHSQSRLFGGAADRSVSVGARCARTP